MRGFVIIGRIDFSLMIYSGDYRDNILDSNIILSAKKKDMFAPKIIVVSMGIAST